MSSERLNFELKWSNDKTTVPSADQPTALQTWDVPDGNSVTLREGLVAIADLVTTGGNDPSRSTQLGLAYREPGDPLDAWTVITEPLNIGPFIKLSQKDQQSSENAQNRRFSFDPSRVDGSSITFEDVDEIALVALGPDAIDGAASQFSYPMQLNQE